MRDRQHIWRFYGQVLAAATSQRPGSPRWTELVVYRLPGGSYVLSRAGRSTLAHRETCDRISGYMVRYLDAADEGRVRRVPCPECNPPVGDAMDPMTMLETSRWSVVQAADPAGLFEVLAGKSQGQIVGMTERIITQLTTTDESFRQWWRHSSQT